MLGNKVFHTGVGNKTLHIEAVNKMIDLFKKDSSLTFTELENLCVPEHVFLHCYACQELLEEKSIAKYGCGLCPLKDKLKRCGNPDSVYNQLMEKVTVQLLERYRDGWS